MKPTLMKKLLIIPVLILSLFAINACKGRKEVSQAQETEADSYADSLLAGLDDDLFDDVDTDDTIYAKYRRTACFGRCPILQLEMYKSGYTIYEGIKWVDKEGVFYAYIDQKDLAELMSTAKAIDFFNMQDEYDQKNVSDLPSRIIFLNDKGTKKEVKNRYQGPIELKQLQAKFDSLIARTDWIPLVENNKY